MKKAKEYAEELLRNNLNNESISSLLISLANEVKEIAETRHAKSNGAFVSIMKEQDLKWRAIARIVEDKLGLDTTITNRRLSTNGFMLFIKKHFPFVIPILEGVKDGR
jgi:hypothetical protein